MIDRVVATMLALAAPVSAAVPSPLAVYRGAARVLVVSAPTLPDPALAQQNRLLKAQGAGLRERDVVVVRIVGDVVTGDPGVRGSAEAWRDAAALPRARFAVVLVGKDGTQAFKEDRPVATAELFSRIDAMPMRREEMARRGR